MAQIMMKAVNLTRCWDKATPSEGLDNCLETRIIGNMMNKEMKLSNYQDVMAQLRAEINRGEFNLEEIAKLYDVDMEMVDAAFADIVQEEYDNAFDFDDVA